jgi:hypothetical protein
MRDNNPYAIQLFTLCKEKEASKYLKTRKVNLNSKNKLVILRGKNIKNR